jgi:hypothetical protein
VVAMIRSAVALLLALTAFVAVSVGVSRDAAAKGYTVIGSGCVQHADTIAAGLATNGSMSTYFASGKTGTIRLICPITSYQQSDENWTQFGMAFKDPDGMGTAYRVRVHFYKIPTLSFTGRTLIQTCDSNTNNRTGYELMYCDFHDFEPIAHEMYWFEVIIDRTSTAGSPEFGGIKLIEFRL